MLARSSAVALESAFMRFAADTQHPVGDVLIRKSASSMRMERGRKLGAILGGGVVRRRGCVGWSDHQLGKPASIGLMASLLRQASVETKTRVGLRDRNDGGLRGRKRSVCVCYQFNG